MFLDLVHTFLYIHIYNTLMLPPYLCWIWRYGLATFCLYFQLYINQQVELVLVLVSAFCNEIFFFSCNESLQKSPKNQKNTQPN